MEFHNSGSSFYHETFASYIRDIHSTLLNITGQHSAHIERAWNQLLRAREDSSVTKETLKYGQSGSTDIFQLSPQLSEISELSRLLGPDQFENGHVIRVQELSKESGQVSGLISVAPPKAEAGFDLRSWTSLLVLWGSKSTMDEPIIPSIQSSADRHALEITSLFDRTIRNIPRNDEWLSANGCEKFRQNVHNFTRRDQPVEFCLPAFPCKSSNSRKTASRDPDYAEQIALESLYKFVRDVRLIYPPGAKIWIVSDGHVFSDCIGVDDDMVDQYSSKLQLLSAKIDGDRSAIDFISLREAFFPSDEIAGLFNPEWIDDINMPTLVDTNTTRSAIDCRKLLMKTCQARSENLRAKIDGGDPSTLALYRGFSRFMLEDLALHRTCEGLSQKKRKTLSSKVAFEMIKRNQAYSSLVELLFPHHVRLSIHAHTNAGPKFGIRLLPSPKVRAIHSLQDRLIEPQSQDLLHTPTPWHNCILRVEGDETLYLIKSGAVQDARNSGEYSGGWIAGDDVQDSALELEPRGYYLLRSEGDSDVEQVLVDEEEPVPSTKEIALFVTESGEWDSLMCTYSKLIRHLVGALVGDLKASFKV